jgi:hypothetical protein
MEKTKGKSNVCKPDSHKTLNQWLEEMQALQAIETVVEKRWTGKIHHINTYRFIKQVPGGDGEDACRSIGLNSPQADPIGKIVCKNSFVTHFKISKKNVKYIVSDGRTRWRVEKENNNVLKTKGYHVEHNFGHGKKHLSALFLNFNLLTFCFIQPCK